MNETLFGTVGIAGVGLIGGSLAKDIRTFGMARRLVGWNRTAAHAERALELGLVDELAPTLESLAEQSDLLVLAMPVDVLVRTLPGLLETVRPSQIVIDVGSSKRALAESVAGHSHRGRFVACHHALERVRTLWEGVGAVLATMSAEAHDRTAALLSHMPHVLAYALARTIKEAERNQALNARFAGGGLASMTRIAHSPITMWEPIFRQNKGPLLEAVDAFAEHLAAFRKAIADDDAEALAELMR